MRRLAVAPALATLAALLALAAPSLASAGSVHLEQFVSTRSSVQVSIVVRRPAAFSMLLRTRTVGRTQLYLLGKKAPTGGPLIDTQTTRCEGAAGSFYCDWAVEKLPPGVYTFRVVRRSGFSTNVELTVRW